MCHGLKPQAVTSLSEEPMNQELKSPMEIEGEEDGTHDNSNCEKEETELMYRFF
jgi:hypothetical protein